MDKITVTITGEDRTLADQVLGPGGSGGHPYWCVGGGQMNVCVCGLRSANCTVVQAIKRVVPGKTVSCGIETATINHVHYRLPLELTDFVCKEDGIRDRVSLPAGPFTLLPVS